MSDNSWRGVLQSPMADNESYVALVETVTDNEPTRHVDPQDARADRRRRMERQRRDYLAARRASKARKPGPSAQDVDAALRLFRPIRKGAE